MLRRPRVQPRAEGEHDVGLREQLGGERRREAAGDPEVEGVAGEQALRRRGRRQQRAAAVAQRGDAPGPPRQAAAPRPPMSTGCCAAASRPAASRTASALGAGGRGQRPASRGRRSTRRRRGLDVDRQHEHDGRALRLRPVQRAGGVRRRGLPARGCARRPRPTEATRSCWSMRKFEPSAAAGVSPASTSSGVRLLAASARAVTAFVSPGPWCTEATPTRPVALAQPSAMQTAPCSWRAATNVAPSAHSALVTTKLPLPTTPKTVSTPCAASVGRRRRRRCCLSRGTRTPRGPSLCWEPCRSPPERSTSPPVRRASRSRRTSASPRPSSPIPVDGQLLVRNTWMSVDPYMRGRMRDARSYVEPFALGEALQGGAIGEVVASARRALRRGRRRAALRRLARARGHRRGRRRAGATPATHPTATRSARWG